MEEGIKPTFSDYVNQQVIDEIEYSLKNNDIKPKVYISYVCSAFFAKDNKDFRLTFDSKILSELKIYNTHFSKYGNEFMDYCKNNKSFNIGRSKEVC